MKLLELALNPRRANLRFSPFRKSLPEGMGRKLEYLFGENATVDPAERAIYSRDTSAPPRALNMALKRGAWAVVRPKLLGDLVELIKYANDNFVAIVPRGSGTSGYGGATPTEGGIVVDMRDFREVVAIDAASLTARVQGNITFYELDRALAKEGLALRQYPTSYYAATVAGWVSQGGGGVGSLKFGPFENDVLEAVIVTPDGKMKTLKGSDLDLVNGAHGISGFIVEVVLSVRKATTLVPFLGTFDDADQTFLAARRLAVEGGAWSLSFFTPEFVAMVNEAAKPNPRLLPPAKHSVLVVLESADDAPAVEKVKAIITSSGGTLAQDKDAKKAWDARFDHLNLKRLGPSVVVGEATIDVTRLGRAVAAVQAAGRMERQCVWGIMVSPRECDVIYYGLEDERRVTYAPALGNALAVIDAVKAQGGKAYSTGVLQANESKAVLGKARLKRLKQWKKKTDANEVFNPGPVLGARMRGVPLRVFPLVMTLQGPLMKGARAGHKHRGLGAEDPSQKALYATIGRANAGELSTLEDSVTTCIACGNCNAVAPQRASATFESELPRGAVLLAQAVLRGDAPLTPEVQRRLARRPIVWAPEAACPVQIPISRVVDLALAAGVEANGALPEHALLAAAAAKEGNVYGKPRAKRGDWAALGWDADAKTLFFGDDLASYEAPEAATAAARVLMNAGAQLQYLGKAEVTSGATLFETGQRQAAREVIAPMLEEIAKRKIDLVVTPDANTARTINLDWPLAMRDEVERATPRAMHAASWIANALKSKKLEITGEKLAKKALVHAPEGLSAAERAAVLDVTKAVAANVIDAPHVDCGHGRGLREFDATLHQQIAEAALRAAKDAGAEVIVAASPGCYVTLKAVAKKAKVAVEVVSLYVLVAERMKVREGGASAPVAVQVEAAPAGPVEPEIPPDHFRVEYVKEGIILAVHKNSNLLAAGEEAGMELPSSCKAGSCDTCSARFEGTPADQSVGVALTAEQQKTFVLTCIARPKGPIRIWSNERPK
ncbi:MAG: FAD-binding protein [Thermoplasmatota archaeon]